MKNIVFCGLIAAVILCAWCSAESERIGDDWLVFADQGTVRSARSQRIGDESLAFADQGTGVLTEKGNVYEHRLLADNYNVLLPSLNLSHETENKMLSDRHVFTLSCEHSFAHDNKFPLPPSKTLNSGYSMPVFGLGTWTLDNHTAEESVYTAILAGYRLFDTARYYGNELGVGRGIRKAIAEGLISREDVFITSKILPSGKRNYDALINESNNALGLKYIDLMLIHQPGHGDQDLYQALQRAVKSGTVRSIGISNYYTPEEYEYIAGDAEIPPAVVQNENHPYYQNTELQKYLQRYGVHVESWYPLGGRGHTHELFADKVIARIAQHHRKSPAQVIIRWHIQAGYIVIPGSKNPKHIRENIDVFGFELTDDEMMAISALNHNRRFENW